MKNKKILQKTQKFSLLIATTLVLVSAGCSWSNPYSKPTTTSTRAPVPISSTQITTQSTASNSHTTSTAQKNAVVQNALEQVGTPYRYGGSTPSGFDCSGLVQYSHARAGISVPRTTRDQLNHFRSISRSNLRAGDLAFFKTGRKQYHVAIMINNSEFVHAPSSGKTVSTSSFSNPYWNSHFLRAGRL